MKAIACRLTERGITRRGVRFSTGSVYEILTSSTYYGQHYFNRRDSRTGAPRPPSQWVGVQVPAIIDESTFNEVQALLQSRSPKRTPPRVVNGPTFLAGLARCGYCGAAMIQNTGKGGLYRYYCCSSKLKKGPSACRGLRTPMEKLDEIVVGEVARHVLDPDRLTAMLDAYVQSAAAQADGAKAQLAKLRHDHTAAAAGIARLLELVEKGLMEAEDPAMRELAGERGRPLRLPRRRGSPLDHFSSDFLRCLCRRAFSLSRQKHDPRRRPKLRPNGHNLASPRGLSGRADRQL